ncbi:hypothetical protein [Microbacterium sp. NPDC076911]|uniref:hypothetical protein n=1 Tax=Microbacterium sp. NPDC076911 TaxID=3154958 RepID=UPI003441FAAC
MPGRRQSPAFDVLGTSLSVSGVLGAVGILTVTVVLALVLRHLILRHSRRQNTVHSST